MRRLHALVPGALLLALAIPAAAQRPPAAADTATYEESAVQRKPVLRNAPQLTQVLARNYPPDMLQQGVSGSVEVRFRVLTDGRVDSASVVVLRVTNPEFSQAALKVVNRMRYRPAQMDGHPVRVWVTTPVNFMVMQMGGTTAGRRECNISVCGPPPRPGSW